MDKSKHGKAGGRVLESHRMFLVICAVHRRRGK